VRELLPYADAAQALTVFIALFGFVPQLRAMIRKRSAAGMELSSWFLWAVSSGLGLFYALMHALVEGNGFPLVLSTGVMLLLNVGTIGLILTFRRSERVERASVLGRESSVLPLGRRVPPVISIERSAANDSDPRPQNQKSELRKEPSAEGILI